MPVFANIDALENMKACDLIRSNNGGAKADYMSSLKRYYGDSLSVSWVTNAVSNRI